METSIVVPAGKQENIIEMSIIQRIHEIRGVRVMLDFDLAEMYGTATKVLKQSVKRNMKRFPNDFMFELTKNEWNELVTNCDHIPKSMKYSYVPSSIDEIFLTLMRAKILIASFLALFNFLNFSFC